MDKCGWSNREVDKRISPIVGKKIHLVGIYAVFMININNLKNKHVFNTQIIYRKYPRVFRLLHKSMIKVINNKGI